MGTSARRAVRTRLFSLVVLACPLIVALGLQARTAPSQTVRPPAAGPAPARPVTSVRVTVLVTDKRGNPVANLTPRDFELREEGTLQTIEAVEPQARLRATGRLIGLFLDEYHVRAGADSARAREALTRFVDGELRPDDRLVVMKPLDSLTAIRLASDRDEIRRTIAGFEGRQGDYAPRTPFETNYLSRDPASLDQARAQMVLSALRALAQRLGAEGDGRKAIVLVSEGFVRRRSRGDERLPDQLSVERSANRFDVAIFPINPHGDGERPVAAGRPRAPVAATVPVPTPVPTPAVAADGGEASTLKALAGETGGAAATPADLFAALQHVGRTLDGGYRLTYRPSHPDDGEYHGIQVRVVREGMQVQARSGYWAPLDEAVRRAQLAVMSSLALGSAIPVRPYHQSPFIKPWFGMARGADGLTRVTFTWEAVDRPSANRRRLEPSALVLSAKAPDGTPLFSGRVAPVAARSLDPKAVARATFEAPPGRVELEITIEGADRKVLDSDVRDVQVPNLAGEATIIAEPELFRVRTEREFVAVSADPDAAPVASREFSRTERLLVRVPAYGPGNTPAIVTARLQNRIGQTMMEIPAMPVRRDGMTQFDLSLAPYAPGDYHLALTARSPAGEARADLSFKITG